MEDLLTETDQLEMAADLLMETDQLEIPDLPMETDRQGIADLLMETDQPEIPGLLMETDQPGTADLLMETDQPETADLLMETDQPEIADLLIIMEIPTVDIAVVIITEVIMALGLVTDPPDQTIISTGTEVIVEMEHSRDMGRGLIRIEAMVSRQMAQTEHRIRMVKGVRMVLLAVIDLTIILIAVRDQMANRIIVSENRDRVDLLRKFREKRQISAEKKKNAV